MWNHFLIEADWAWPFHGEMLWPPSGVASNPSHVVLRDPARSGGPDVAISQKARRADQNNQGPVKEKGQQRRFPWQRHRPITTCPTRTAPI